MMLLTQIRKFYRPIFNKHFALLYLRIETLLKKLNIYTRSLGKKEDLEETFSFGKLTESIISTLKEEASLE